MKRTRTVGLAGAGLSLAVGATLAVGAAGAGAAPATSKAKSGAARPSVAGSYVSVPPGGHGFASVTCPAGSLLTGGGGQTSAFHIFFTDSYFSGNTWFIRGTNTGTATESLRAVAVCAGNS